MGQIIKMAFRAIDRNRRRSFFSALAVNTRAREVLLPILLFPVLVRDLDALGIYKALGVPDSAVAKLKGPLAVMGTSSPPLFWSTRPVPSSPVTVPWTTYVVEGP